MSAPSLRLALVTDGEPFHGASPEERALGGSETALVQVARALARRGHGVQVFCRCPRPGEYQGVIYRDSKELVRACPEERLDVLVVSRFFAALDLPWQAGLRVLWNHDLLVNPEPLAKRLDDLDLCLVLSRFHAQDFTRALPPVAPKLARTRNGLDLELLAASSQGVERHPGLVTYVSRPERGLRLLLEQIWPRLHAALPHLTLALCGYQVAEATGSSSWRREQEQVARLLEHTPGLRLLGPLAKADYYRHLASCECLLYPCTFPEISCLAVLEAQALGTPVLTSDSFALSESVVTPAFRVGDRPGSPEYVQAYIKQALDMLTHPGEAMALARQGQAAVVAAHGWNIIAQEWEDLFLSRLAGQSRGRERALAAGLLMTGEAGLAARLVGTEGRVRPEGPPPPDPGEAQVMEATAEMVRGSLAASGRPPRLGVLAADQGRTARALAALLPSAEVAVVEPGQPGLPPLDLLLIRDRLERETDPRTMLEWACQACAPTGHILLGLAVGAWPLKSPGHLARAHDLGRDDVEALCPGRPLQARYLPQGLVRVGRTAYHLGRWLILLPAAGPPIGRLDPEAPLRRARPAPPELVAEVSHAGLL